MRNEAAHLAKRGIDISNSMPPGGQGLNKKGPTVIKLMNQQKQMILSMGQFLGEEVMHVMRDMDRTESSIRVPALYSAASGTLKNTSVFCPLFSAFGPEPVRQRLQRGNAKVLVTTERLYRKTIADLRGALPELKHILLTDARENVDSGVWALEPLLAQVSPEFVVPRTGPDDMALLHFTSGTTGMPKGAIHVHNAALMHYITGKFALDLHPEDIFWCPRGCQARRLEGSASDRERSA